MQIFPVTAKASLATIQTIDGNGDFFGMATAAKAAKVAVRKSYALECGARLRLLREALGFDTQRGMAERVNDAINFTENQLSTYETGKALVPPDFLCIIKRHFRVPPFDWVYANDDSLLPRIYGDKLTELQNDRR